MMHIVYTCQVRQQVRPAAAADVVDMSCDARHSANIVYVHVDNVNSEYYLLKIKCNVFSFVEVHFSTSVFNINKSI